MHYFIVLVIISVCVKCFNNFFVSSWLFCHFDIDVCIYSNCPFFDCQADFDVDNVQCRELVNSYGVKRYIRVIIIITI